MLTTVFPTVLDSTVKDQVWYEANPQEILHSKNKSMQDALRASMHERAWIVYLRHALRKGRASEIDHYGTAKIGKGYFEDGDDKRDPAAGGINGILETLAAVHCASEEAAYALEALLHRHYHSLSRWDGRIVNAQGKESGEEWFNGFTDIASAIDEFNATIATITGATSVGKIQCIPEHYQFGEIGDQSGASLTFEYLRNDSLSEFFRLMKPRSGKNITALFAYSLFARYLKDNDPTYNGITVDLLSRWPSAHVGMFNDVKKYKFVDGIDIAIVDTGLTGWEEYYFALRKQYDIVIRSSSIQSINRYFADADTEKKEKFDEHKAQVFIDNPTPYALIDESDSGMRTEKSAAILRAFGYTKIDWQSGTDLHALKHLTRPGNHFIYDMIQEILDVLAGKVKGRSLIRSHAIEAVELPFGDMLPEEMNSRGITRRITNLCNTVTSTGNNVSLDKRTGLVIDDVTGMPVTFEKPGEFKRYWEMMYFWENDSGIKAPEDHKHIFATMPSKNSCFALYNAIVSGELECDHTPILANFCGDAAGIEENVNLKIAATKKSVFITVGRMLRGGKAPWSAVMRFDEVSDWKLGHQIDLRGQNTNDPYFDVYDGNMFRCSSMKYELIRARSNGKKINSEGAKLYGLMPMTRKGKFKSVTSTWEEVIEASQAGSIIEGYTRKSILNKPGIVAAKEMLAKVGKNKKSATAKDPQAGKIKAANKKGQSNGRQGSDPVAELEKQAITVATNLPLLVVLTNGMFDEIDSLINNTNDDIFIEWCQHCNLATLGLTNTLARSMLINLFDAELINNQLAITCRRFKNDGVETFTWDLFNRSEAADVSTPSTAVEKMLATVPNPEDCSGLRTIDPSCSTGEWVVQRANQLRNLGIDPKEHIFYADTSPINIRITSLRIGFNNGLCYTVPKQKINPNKKKRVKTPFVKLSRPDIVASIQDQIMTAFGNKKFDLYVTNPPFQKPDKTGRDDDNLWPLFLTLGHKITVDDGYMVMITPASWASLGANKNSPGSTIRKKCFDTKQVELVDFTIGSDFDVGSTFTGYTIKNAKADAELNTTLIFSDKTIVGKFKDYPCFPLKYSNAELVDIFKSFSGREHYTITDDDPYHTQRASMKKKIEKGDYSAVQSESHPYRTYHTSAQSHLYSSFKNEFHDQWKAVFSYSGTWKVEVTNDCSLGDAGMCILCNSEDEALNVQSVMASEPVKFLIDKVFRWSGYYSGLFICSIPKLPTTKIYSTDEIYTLLFTPTQAALVQSLIASDQANKRVKKSKVQ